MKIGIVGKTNVGKSTTFSSASMIDVEISNRIFTTIKPNVGATYAREQCVEADFSAKCSPKNSKCENGVRLIPLTLIDVAGLVPDAHAGKGLGNQFLSDLMEAEGLIHVFDLSGTTDSEGNPTSGYDPEKDIEFLEKEMDYWIEGILKKNWDNIERKSKQGKPLHEVVYEQLSGLGVQQDRIKSIVERGYSDLLDLARKIRAVNKPIILAGNKIDLKSSWENYQRLKERYDIVPVCAEAELALRKADRAGLIKYVPGSSDFESLKELPPEQTKALEFIRENVLKKYGGTGVQTVINKLVFEKLRYMPVYPVEDDHKYSDKNGKVLPDVYLMKEGSTALELAYKVHSDIGDKFIGAVDARTKKKIGREYILKKNDVIKILTR
jgi:ribosome-binding ATPase YchF (GTP1/OBG family)